jgi:hypothetical protein
MADDPPAAATPVSDGGAADDAGPADEADGANNTGVTVSEDGARDVVLPLRAYKAVTVFSTLFAVAFILAGFVLLDEATDRATAEIAEINPWLAILGLAALIGGAAIYAFSTRFRAEGMGKSKDMSDESSDDG